MQSVMRYHGARGSIAANNEMMDVEDRFDVLMDANDLLLERVVSSFLSVVVLTAVAIGCMILSVKYMLVVNGLMTFLRFRDNPNGE